MVRAIYQKGQIQLLDPLPESWHEGQELAVGVIDEEDAAFDRESIRSWHQERLASSSDLTEDDDQRMQASLDEQRQIGKELLLREQETM